MSGGSDPRELLDAMNSMLGEYGDIKGPQEVITIISLMNDAEKALSRFTFLNILRATIEIASDNNATSETVHKFVKDGGCNVLNKWLQEGMNSQNLPLILDVLELLEAMPITIDALKQGNIGKLVKQLSKSEETDANKWFYKEKIVVEMMEKVASNVQYQVKDLASSVLSKWMILVKGKPKKSKKSSEHSEESSAGSSPSSGNSKRPRENSVGKEPKANQPPEKKTKTLAEAKSNVTSVAKPPPKAKVIAPLPKPIVMESSGFMNALIQQSAAPTKKKKKVPPPPSPKQTSAGPLEEILFNQTQTHKQGEEKDKASKEKDEKEQETGKEKTENPESESAQQEETPETSQDDVTREKPSDATPDSVAPTVTSEENAPSEEEVKTKDEASPMTATVEPMETEKKEEAKKEKDVSGKKKKRNITWATDDKLVEYHYYEPDDEERVAVQHIINFHDAQHQEAIRERQRVEQAKRLSEDKMVEKVQWYRPKPLDVTEILQRGENSQEKISQKERESKILAHLFFSKSSLPISPGEPEPEAKPASSASSQPIVIPHDENGSVYPQSTGLANPEPGPEATTAAAGAADANVTLPPALAALLANATKGAGNSATNSAGSANAALSNVDVQALLKKLVASQEQGEQNQNLNELGVQRFPSPLMGQTLRVPGRVGLLSHDPSRHASPEFRSRGLLPTPGPPLDPTRFLGMRGRFPLPGGPRMRHPLPGQRMAGPMGRGGMPNRFPIRNPNQDAGEEYYSSDGDEGQFPGRGRGLRHPSGRGRPLCRHFKSPRGCLRGNSCPFLHPRGPPNGPPV